MNQRLNGRRALVTGGAGGRGNAALAARSRRGRPGRPADVAPAFRASEAASLLTAPTIFIDGGTTGYSAFAHGG